MALFTASNVPAAVDKPSRWAVAPEELADDYRALWGGAVVAPGLNSDQPELLLSLPLWGDPECVVRPTGAGGPALTAEVTSNPDDGFTGTPAGGQGWQRTLTPAAQAYLRYDVPGYAILGLNGTSGWSMGVDVWQTGYTLGGGGLDNFTFASTETGNVNAAGTWIWKVNYLSQDISFHHQVGAGNQRNVFTNAVAPVNQLNRYMLVRGPGSGPLNLWINGVKHLNTIGVSNPTAGSIPVPLRIAQTRNAGGQVAGVAGHYVGFNIWRSPLSDEQVLLHQIDPYGIWRPHPRRARVRAREVIRLRKRREVLFRRRRGRAPAPVVILPGCVEAGWGLVTGIQAGAEVALGVTAEITAHADVEALADIITDVAAEGVVLTDVEASAEVCPHG